MKYHVLYNPLAGRVSKQPEVPLAEAVQIFQDITLIKDIPAYLAGLPAEDGVVLCGGDGTVHCFLNSLGGQPLTREVLYYPCGSGNDFAVDVEKNNGAPFALNPYIEKLPTVQVSGVTKRFLNNVGYGIDGYCCEVGDRQRESSDKPVNYTSIAIKGLLGGYKPRNATVTIDGKTMTFKKVWLAATMNGRYYGGGMNAAPAQDRLNAEHTVSIVVMFGSGKLHSLMAFPSIFKGKLVDHKKLCHVYTGHTVDVSFDVPCALQIDGETYLNVSSYHVDAYQD